VNSSNNNDKEHGGNFVNGFMWGAIVGGGISFVLSHKKGRELLRDISENGVEALRGVLDPDNIDELKREFKDHLKEEEYDYRERGRYYSPAPSTRSTAPKKRVFKGIKKK
jgi:TFIIF-interacting CTD phosphatase-like protein